MDVHTKLMRNYKEVPEWWFTCILVLNIISATLLICECYKNQLQLPWWGVLLACGFAFVFTLPIGIITATTNQTPGLNVKIPPRAMFMAQTPGLNVKIPPRAMFMAQVIETLVSALVHLGTAWWLMEIVPYICDRTHLPPWTCPSDHVFYDASVMYWAAENLWRSWLLLCHKRSACPEMN